MAEKTTLDTKIYEIREGKKLSMKYLLEYFAKQGRMRVSDLHLKVGCPPIYRLDGKLQKMKTPDLTASTVELFVEALLSDKEIASLKSDGAVDSSCFIDGMQFRLNCFHDNDGLAVAIRALEETVPVVEEIGFQNNVWKDIVTAQQGLVLLTGITGAGKSTTIASLIDRIARTRPCRIITLEDPIEYRLSSTTYYCYCSVIRHRK